MQSKCGKEQIYTNNIYRSTHNIYGMFKVQSQYDTVPSYKVNKFKLLESKNHKLADVQNKSLVNSTKTNDPYEHIPLGQDQA